MALLNPASARSAAAPEHCSQLPDSPKPSGPIAAMSFCFAYNLQKNKNGESPWNLRKLEEYNGVLAPFGSYINYIPPTTTKTYLKQSKMTDRTHPGVILGYEVGYGGKWRRGYVVCPLEAFANVTLTSTSKLVAQQINQRITVTEDVHLVPGTSPWFPLIDRSHYANRTLCGIESTSSNANAPAAGPLGGKTLGTSTAVRTDVVIPDDDDDLDIPGQPPGDAAPQTVDDEPMVFNADWKAASSGDPISAPPLTPLFPPRTFATEGSLVPPVVSTDGVATPPTITSEQDAATKPPETTLGDPVTPLVPPPKRAKPQRRGKQG